MRLLSLLPLASITQEVFAAVAKQERKLMAFDLVAAFCIVTGGHCNAG